LPLFYRNNRQIVLSVVIPFILSILFVLIGMALMWGNGLWNRDTTFEVKVCADDITLYFTHARLYAAIASLGLA
jgi:hypothetical protein